MNKGIKYGLIGFASALTLFTSGAIVGYTSGTEARLRQGREEIVQYLNEESSEAYEQAKNSVNFEDKKRLLIRSDDLAVVVRDLEFMYSDDAMPRDGQ